MSEYVWYFAYGSNLHADVFRGRRGITWRRALPARLDGWRLVFDKTPLFPVGESFANLVADAKASACGVVYEVSREDMAHIELTEGVLLGNYDRVDVEVVLLAPGDDGIEVLPARTLTSSKRDETLCPSDRYMQLVIDGALTHGLPPEHLEYLRSIRALPSTREALEMRALIDPLMKKGR